MFSHIKRLPSVLPLHLVNRIAWWIWHHCQKCEHPHTSQHCRTWSRIAQTDTAWGSKKKKELFTTNIAQPSWKQPRSSDFQLMRLLQHPTQNTMGSLEEHFSRKSFGMCPSSSCRNTLPYTPVPGDAPLTAWCSYFLKKCPLTSNCCLSITFPRYSMIRVSEARSLAALKIFRCFWTRVTLPSWSYQGKTGENMRIKRTNSTKGRSISSAALPKAAEDK